MVVAMVTEGSKVLMHTASISVTLQASGRGVASIRGEVFGRGVASMVGEGQRVRYTIVVKVSMFRINDDEVMKSSDEDDIAMYGVVMETDCCVAREDDADVGEMVWVGEIDKEGMEDSSCSRRQES